MKKPFWQTAMTVIVLMLSPAAYSAVHIGFNPIATSATSVELALAISGLGSGIAPSISAFDLDIAFDNAHLQFSHAVFGDALDVLNLGGNVISATETHPGNVNLFEHSLDLPEDLNALQADEFTLATLIFNVNVLSTSTLTISLNALSDAEGEALLATVTPTTVSTVPIMPAAGLMFSSLILVSKLGRWRFCKA